MLSPYSSNEYHPESKNTTWYKMVGMVPDGASVLDVGCSTGKLGEVLKKRKNATVTGIDITADDIAEAKKVLDNAFVFDVEADRLHDKRLSTYDVIIFADVLEHMKNPVQVLTDIKRLLKPGGRLVFSIPNMAHMFVRLQLLEGSFRYTETGLLDYTHLHFYDAEEVDRIFTEARYDIKEYDSTTFDYPESLLKEKLANLGLKPESKFFKLASQKEAVIFEYVGWAQPSSKKKPRNARIATSSPLDDVLAYVQRIKDAEASDKKALKAKADASEKHIQKLDAQNFDLRFKIEELESRLKHLNKHPVRHLVKKYAKRRRS